MYASLRRTAAVAVLAIAACAPAGEPIIAPLPQGAALDTAGRPYVRTVEPPANYLRAVRADTRSLSGAPGEDYWQQRVRYDIRATLDPRERRVTGTERVVYFNNSPDRLGQVVFNLYQNLFTEDFVGRGSPLATGGLELTLLVADGDTIRPLSQSEYEENLRQGRFVPGAITTGTLSRVLLPDTLAPGDSVVFHIEWNYRVPPSGAPRTGFEDALGGRVFQVAQWYPQVAVYDDVEGFDVTPYRGSGEFFLEYGDYEVSLTLPAGWTVGATGELVNADEILRPEVRARLAAAMRSDTTVRVLPASELERPGATTATSGDVTWRFTARDVRDFGWATSNRYLWDVRRAEIPTAGGGTRAIPVHSFHRPGAPHWDEAARFGEHSVEHISRAVVPYAYPQLTIAEGPIYGMEYPMIVFVGRPDARRDLYEVVAHEVAHEWFPMMVGQDEAAFAWMDEGFATYYEARSAADFFEGYDPWETPREAYLALAGDKGEAPMMRHIDLVFGPASGVSAYYKPGTLLRSLQRVLGDDVYRQAMETYANEWMFRHPYPWDFFNTVERVAGRDLDWFWYPWFYRTVTMDQGISSVSPVQGGVQVTVRDFGQVPAPTEVVVTTAEGQRVTETIPVERWLDPSTRVATVTVPVVGAIARVEIDPDRYFPDVNRRNNVWTP